MLDCKTQNDDNPEDRSLKTPTQTFKNQSNLSENSYFVRASPQDKDNHQQNEMNSGASLFKYSFLSRPSLWSPQAKFSRLSRLSRGDDIADFHMVSEKSEIIYQDGRQGNEGDKEASQQQQEEELPFPYLKNKVLIRMHGFLSIFCYVGLIVVARESKHSAAELSLIKGISGTAFGFFYSRLSHEPVFIREGWIPEKYLLRGVMGAINSFVMLYGNKVMNPTIFAVLSRMKVFFTLIIHSLVSAETMNPIILLAAITSFIGVCMVMDPSIFGLPSVSREFESMILLGVHKEMIALLASVGYMILSSVIRSIMVLPLGGISTSQDFVYAGFISILTGSMLTFNNPLVLQLSEVHTYIKISLLSWLLNYSMGTFLNFETKLTVFIIIQMCLLFLTYCLDIYYFDVAFNRWNLLGGVIVAGSAFLAVLKA